MAYPYKHLNRAQNSDSIELHKLGPDAGGGVAFTASLTTTGVLYTVNLPYNRWGIDGVIWGTGHDRGLSLKVRPWIDHAQTILGPAVFLSQPGSTAAASVITIAAVTTTGANGAAFHVLGGLSGGGATTQQLDGFSPIHGFQVAVTAATALTRGVYDWEVVCVPEA
jgi:mRNA-degrading endonuclease toxin of MazEF toxin-antitoxin module